MSCEAKGSRLFQFNQTVRKGVIALAAVSGAGLALAAAAPANAVPLLQFFAEGATYDTSTASWKVTGAPGDSVRLWVVGNLTGPGSSSNDNPGGAINDVHLLISFASSSLSPFTLTGDKAGGTGSFNGFTDPSKPADVSPDSASPRPASDITTLYPTANPSLMSHQGGMLDTPRHFFDFALGDFTVTDSELTDFSGATASPSPDSSDKVAQINVYDFTIPTGGITDWHFDIVGYSGKKGTDCTGTGRDRVCVVNPVFEVAPFSHDGDGASTTRVPEPLTLALFGTGLIGLGLARKRANKSARG